MEDNSGLPPPHPPPSCQSRPSQNRAAPKGKHQRRLGLAPPPSNLSSAATPIGSSSAGQGRGSTMAGEAEEPSLQTRKRQARDTSSSASRERRVKNAGAATPTQPRPTSSISSIPGSYGAPQFISSTPAASHFCASASPAFVAQRVFDGMPESIDDETFLSILDVDLSHTVDVDGDGDDDGVPPSTPTDEYISDGDVDMSPTIDVDGDVLKKGSRGSNFTIDEDKTLVKAWEAISLDPITGSEQSGKTYWKRIYDHFCHNNKSGTYRPQVSVNHRWHTIQISCTKWAECLVKVERLNPSGANAQDKVNIAQRLYKAKPGKEGGKIGKAFALHHCWVLLEHHEKWRTRNQEVPPKSKKSSYSCSPIDDSDDEGADMRCSLTPSSMPSEKRPPGRKGQKDKLKKGVEGVYKESLDNMAASRKEAAADMKEFRVAKWVDLKVMEDRRMMAEERRAAAEERRAVAEEQGVAVEERRIAIEETTKRLEQEQRIMFMDPSKLDEKGRAYYELMRDQIWASRSGSTWAAL